jgi:TolA-binding protein
MLRKTPKPSAKVCALLLCSALGAVSTSFLAAQTPASPALSPVEVVAPATLNRIFSEVESAFTAKNYGMALEKTEELLKLVGNSKDAPLELLNFNIGLANLLGQKPAEAEEAFKACLKKFPKGEYTSRCHLGIGQAAIQQGTPEKKQAAIESLKLAAQDPKLRSEAGLSLGQLYDGLGKRDTTADDGRRRSDWSSGRCE